MYGLSGMEEEGTPILIREHLEVCEGYTFLRVGRDLSNERDRTKYFMEVMRMKSMEKTRIAL